MGEAKEGINVFQPSVLMENNNEMYLFNMIHILKVQPKQELNNCKTLFRPA